MSVENMGEKKSFQKKDDPKDQLIKQKIKDHVESTQLGRDMMARSKDLQVQYYKDALAHIKDPDYLHRLGQDILRDLAQATNARIIEGEQHLSGVPKDRPVFGMINHFSIYKETSIPQSELGISEPQLDDIPPPPMHFAAFYPVAQKLGLDLNDSHLELPGQLGVIQQAAGDLQVPRETGNFTTVLEKAREWVREHPQSLLVNFPEGGTSGKQTEEGPFDMIPFHTGTFRIAAEVGATIVPMAMYFNPNSGFEIGVFKPFTLDRNPNQEHLKEVVGNTQAEMQAWLDQRKAA